MTRVFLDTSVILAATFSSKGASREIIRRALQGSIAAVISDFVIEEARRNVASRFADLAEKIDIFFASNNFEVVQATFLEVQAAAKYIAAKDAPIVAAAKQAKVDYLVSMDKQHLANIEVVPIVRKQLGVNIVLPEMLLDIL